MKHNVYSLSSPFSSPPFPFLLFSFPFLSFFSFSSPFPFPFPFLFLSSSFPFLFSLPFPLFSFLSPFFPFPIFGVRGGSLPPCPPLATPLAAPFNPQIIYFCKFRPQRAWKYAYLACKIQNFPAPCTPLNASRKRSVCLLRSQLFEPPHCWKSS